MPSSLTALSVADIGCGLRAGSCTCTEIVQASLNAIDESQPVLNAFVRVDAASALRRATRLDRELKSGRNRGPLHGVPVAIKDLIAVEKLPMLAGSSTFRRVCRSDAAIVAALRNAGAIVVGLTRLNEFALGPTGLNPHDGGARNPRDLGRIPGGSSSGSAVAVAASLTPIAIGTDTGGSVRIPAALCGVVGLKPTHGLLSTAGVMPLSRTLDDMGLLARSVGDISLVLRALKLLVPFDESTQPSLMNVRFGVLEEASANLAAAVNASFHRSLQVISAQGANVFQVNIEGIASISEVSAAIVSYEAWQVHGSRFRSDPMAFGADIRDRIAQGRTIGTGMYKAALRTMGHLRAAMGDTFSTLSYLVSPTVAVEALPIAEAGIAARRSLLARNTRFHNVLGIPAISIPSPTNALPVGFQIAARSGADGNLLATAQALERLFASQ